jgi:hypothetical protein
MHVITCIFLRFMPNNIQKSKSKWAKRCEELYGHECLSTSNQSEDEVEGFASIAKLMWLLVGALITSETIVVDNHQALMTLLSKLALLFRYRYDIHSKTYGLTGEDGVSGQDLIDSIEEALNHPMA